MSLAVNTVLEIITRDIRQEKEVKESVLKVKLSLLTGDMILHVENANKSTRKKVLEQINESSKVIGYKVNVQKVKVFLYTDDDKSKNEIKKTILLTRASKRIKYLQIYLPEEA